MSRGGHGLSLQKVFIMEFEIEEIIDATKGKLVRGDTSAVIKRISTDSRTLQENDLFVALSGEKFDGHDFLDQVAEKGGIGAIVSRPVDVNLPIMVEVDDTLNAYGDIAKANRKKFDIPIIAITGSNGKTTTKNMTASILSQRFCVLRPEKSFNNQIGVPATLLKLNHQHEVAVLELGTNMPGEITRLSQIAQPNIGVITNVGATHLEKLGSIEGVAEEKSDLLKDVEFSVLNADDDNFDLLAKKANGQVVTFGVRGQRAMGQWGYSVKTSPEGLSARTYNAIRDKHQAPRTTHHAPHNITASDISLTDDGRPKFNLIFDDVPVCEIELPCLGEYNVYNALAAASVGRIMGLDYKKIKVGLEKYKPAEMRMQKINQNGITIINDAYNSNPRSLSLALEFFSKLDCQGKRVAVLADMLELGENSAELHRQIGEKMPSSIDVLITVGDCAKLIAEAAKETGLTVHSFQSNLEVSRLLNEIVTEDDAVLLKGSRGMKLEEVLEEI